MAPPSSPGSAGDGGAAGSRDARGVQAPGSAVSCSRTGPFRGPGSNQQSGKKSERRTCWMSDVKTAPFPGETKCHLDSPTWTTDVAGEAALTCVDRRRLRVGRNRGGSPPREWELGGGAVLPEAGGASAPGPSGEAEAGRPLREAGRRGPEDTRLRPHSPACRDGDRDRDRDLGAHWAGPGTPETPLAPLGPKKPVPRRDGRARFRGAHTPVPLSGVARVRLVAGRRKAEDGPGRAENPTPVLGQPPAPARTRRAGFCPAGRGGT